MTFTFKPRDQSVIDKKETQQGNEFTSFIREEYKLYKVRKGENLIRILPQDAQYEREDYGEVIYVHFGIGPDNGSVLCNTRMGGGACPVCEARARAERASDDKLADDLKITKRVAVWILDRKAPDTDGPVLWTMPWTVDKDITKASKDRMTGRSYVIEHPTEGYDIYFDKDGEGRTTKYTGFQMARSPTSVPESALNFVSENPVLATLFERDYDEVAAIFQGVTSQAKPRGNTDRPRDDAPRDDVPPPASEADYGATDRDNTPPTSPQRPARPVREERPAQEARPNYVELYDAPGRPRLTRPHIARPVDNPAPQAPTDTPTLSPAAQRAALLKARLGK